MYAKQLSEDEIASKLDRNKMEVLTKIKDGGTSFRNMIIILMSQDNKTTKVISERLGISHSELIKIVANMGGELKKTEDQL
ncbi:MAG: putative CopG family antitoxin [Ancylomarina sp.]|jgi:predicted CopG family antitoxin